MTEKNIFVYKLFMLLNISNLSLFVCFFCKNCTPTPWKNLPPIFQQPPSQSWSSVKPPFFENLVRGSIPPSPPGETGVHTMLQEYGKLKIRTPSHVYFTGFNCRYRTAFSNANLFSRILLIDSELPTFKWISLKLFFKHLVNRSLNSYQFRDWIVYKVFLNDFVHRF